MNKRQLAVLERVFTDEVNRSKYPTYIKSKVAQQLCEDGYLGEVSVTLPGAIPVVIKGYQLTHAGRFAYCDSCRDVEEP
ncbi:hypothetical protein R84981_003001 [Carnimonas sp. R-84981]|uniref:hypothetical protein n=1 Tax=Carnimonas bestiolae TaxID=3402172 RepID=UPI003EDC5081